MINEYTLHAVFSNMKKAVYDDNTICSILGISMWKLRQSKRRLSHDVVLQPKTICKNTATTFE